MRRSRQGARGTDFDRQVNADVLTPNRRWNALPRDGYTAMVQRMIAGIAIETRFDYLRRQHEVVARKLLIFTGPIDEYFGYKYGRLKYRAQERIVGPCRASISISRMCRSTIRGPTRHAFDQSNGNT